MAKKPPPMKPMPPFGDGGGQATSKLPKAGPKAARGSIGKSAPPRKS